MFHATRKTLILAPFALTALLSMPGCDWDRHDHDRDRHEIREERHEEHRERELERRDDRL